MANESNIIYAIEVCQFRAKVRYCKMSLKWKVSRGQGVRFLQCCWWRLKSCGKLHHSYW